MLSTIVTTVYKGYNLGQIKMEHKCPLPPKSRMKPREGHNTPCSHHYYFFFFGWGGGGGVGLKFLLNQSKIVAFY